MAVFLAEDEHIVIYNEMLGFYPDVPFFDELVSARLQQAIVDCSNIVVFTVEAMEVFAESYYTDVVFSTQEDKIIWKQIKKIFDTLFVLFVSRLPEVTAHYFNSVQELKDNYPLLDIADDDVQLLTFRNMVKACFCAIVPDYRKRQAIIEISNRLTGLTRDRIIMGSGMTKAQICRLEIFEIESDLPPIPMRQWNPPNAPVLIPPNAGITSTVLDGGAATEELTLEPDLLDYMNTMWD